MTKKDIAELKKRFTKKSCTFTKMCGCYVNSEKIKVLNIDATFLNLEEDDFYKYLDIAKKVLSGTFGNNILNLEFKKDENRQDFFWRLDKSLLKDEELLNEFYDLIIENYEHTGNYLILIFHDNYDIVKKDKNNDDLDDSSEVYEYILCAVCPVELSKAGLGYNEEENKIKSIMRDWVVGMPENGFVFPAFSERSADVNSVIYYTKTPKSPYYDFMENILTCESKKTATEEKIAFRSIVEDSIPDENEAENVFIEMQKSVNYVISEKEVEFADEDTPVVLTENDIKDIVQEIDIDDEVKEKITDSFSKEFGEMPPSANNVLDNKAVETAAQREHIVRLEKQVQSLKGRIEDYNQPAKSDEIILRVSQQKSELIKTEVIDGRKYILIPVDENDRVEINNYSADI